MRSRPRQHVRRTRRGPVLVNRGVAKRVHRRYIGFSPEQQGRVERVININPRLAEKIRKSIANIRHDNKVHGSFSSSSKEIAIGDSAFDTGDDELTRTLKHEVTHGAHVKKLGETFSDAQLRTAKIYGKNHHIRDGHEVSEFETYQLRGYKKPLSTQYLALPTEVLAHSETSNVPKSQFLNTRNYMHHEMLKGGGINTISADHANIEQFKEELRQSPKIKELPDEWIP